MNLRFGHVVFFILALFLVKISMDADLQTANAQDKHDPIKKKFEAKQVKNKIVKTL